MPKKEIIFIVGSGRSGSTILDMLLGGAENGFSTGEFFRIYDTNSFNSMCTCGQSIANCSVWSHVISHKKNNFSKPKGFLPKLYHFFSVLLYSKLNINLLEDKYFKFSLNNTELFDELFEVTAAKVIVDSSKDLLRALTIERMLKDKYSFKYIYLTRDAIAQSLSRTKTHYKLRIKDESRKVKKPENIVVSLRKALISWVLVNLKYIMILKLLNIKYYHLRYRDLVNNTSKFIINFNKITILKLDNSLSEFTNRKFHLINGNPSRFNAQRIEKRNDFNSKKVAFKYKFLFFFSGGWLLNKILRH